MLKPVEKQRVAEEIASQLRSLILTGQYAAGAKLPPERELAKKLGVNRASLREALKKLEHMGLVKIRQGDGTRVLDFMSSAGIDLLSHLLQANASPRERAALLRDVLEFRRIYAREVARLAAKRAEPEDLERLAEIASACDAPDVTPERLLQLDFEFYVALTRAARNRVFSLLINTTRQAVLSYASFFAQLTVSAEVVRRHQRALLKALAKKDAAAAAKVVETYMSRGAAVLASFFD